MPLDSPLVVSYRCVIHYEAIFLTVSEFYGLLLKIASQRNTKMAAIRPFWIESKNCVNLFNAAIPRAYIPTFNYLDPAISGKCAGTIKTYFATWWRHLLCDQGNKGTRHTVFHSCNHVPSLGILGRTVMEICSGQRLDRRTDRRTDGRKDGRTERKPIVPGGD